MCLPTNQSECQYLLFLMLILSLNVILENIHHWNIDTM